MKLNLKIDEKVKILLPGFENATGINLGKSTENIVDFYIILLDEPIETHKAIAVPEGCLRRIVND